MVEFVSRFIRRCPIHLYGYVLFGSHCVTRQRDSNQANQHDGGHWRGGNGCSRSLKGDALAVGQTVTPGLHSRPFHRTVATATQCGPTLARSPVQPLTVQRCSEWPTCALVADSTCAITRGYSRTPRNG